MRKIILGRWQTAEALLRPSLAKSLDILAPLAFYWLITSIVTLAAGCAIGMICTHYAGSAYALWLQTYSNQLSVWMNAVAIVVTYPVTIHFYKDSYVKEMSQVVRRRNTQRLLRSFALIFVWAGIVALGLNIALNYLNIFQNSDTYTRVSNIQYSVSLPVGIFIFGILTPIGEELIFRGVIYNRLKRYFSPLVAIVASALIFGIYHGNLVQFIYASLMGICMALLYESHERLLAPILFHCGANTFIYMITTNEALASAAFNVPVMVVCLIVAVVGCLLL
jgi:membrane protease YdiL (CAAX protease family)